MKADFRKYISSLTMIAFLFSAFLPFFVTYNVPSEKTELSSLFGDKILICTAEGFKWVSIAELEKGSAPKQHKNIKCPVCFIAAHKVETTPPAAPSPLYTHSVSTQVVYAAFLNRILQTAETNPYHGRAPPAFV